MIAVIADDLTGAAELAGIGLRYMNNVKVVTEAISLDADMIVVSTDSRSMDSASAVEKNAKVTTAIAALKPQLIYKKIDSALRGHVVEEIREHLSILRLQKALLVPANPALGRKIINGVYYLHEQPIHLTAFSKDPEFPITTSIVSDMVSAGPGSVYVLNHMQPLPESGIVVGDVASEQELDSWARRVTADVFPAGGSGFFAAILNSLHIDQCEQTASQAATYSSPSLFVCGSAYAKSVDLVRSVKENGGPVVYIPADFLLTGKKTATSYQDRCSEVVHLLAQHRKSIIAIDPESIRNHSSDAKSFRENTAVFVQDIFNEAMIGELFIEGGSTATAIIRRLGFETFYPVQEITAGVVRMRVEGRQGLHLTIKPGSYDWSKEVWTF
jgi:D-threonate/D-erythronate kinase